MSIIPSGAHLLALRADGSVVAWGRNVEGQCDVPPGIGFVAIAAGSRCSAAIAADGSLLAWGSNLYGQCDIPAGNDFVAIAAGHPNTFAIQVPEPSAAAGLLTMAVTLSAFACSRRRIGAR